MILVSNPGGAAAAAPDSFPTPSSVSDSWNHESADHTAFELPSLWLIGDTHVPLGLGALAPWGGGTTYEV